MGIKNPNSSNTKGRKSNKRFQNQFEVAIIN